MPYKLSFIIIIIIITGSDNFVKKLSQSYNFETEDNKKAILAAGAIFYVCIATEIASISVSVANLLVLPVAYVSTSGLHLILLSEVGQR